MCRYATRLVYSVVHTLKGQVSQHNQWPRAHNPVVWLHQTLWRYGLAKHGVRMSLSGALRGSPCGFLWSTSFVESKRRRAVRLEFAANWPFKAGQPRARP